jgi:hypothetical protein
VVSEPSGKFYTLLDSSTAYKNRDSFRYAPICCVLSMELLQFYYGVANDGNLTAPVSEESQLSQGVRTRDEVNEPNGDFSPSTGALMFDDHAQDRLNESDPVAAHCCFMKASLVLITPGHELESGASGTTCLRRSCTGSYAGGISGGTCISTRRRIAVAPNKAI